MKTLKNCNQTNMYTQTSKIPVQKDINIVKIAVEMTGKVPQLIEFNQKQPLTGIITVCI